MNLLHVEAVPRSVSTALSRSLNETDNPSIFVNEPFNRMTHDIDVAAGHILDAVEPVIDVASERVTVVTKNMARNLSQVIFKDWIDICDGIVWSVRDPRIQIGSLLTRIVNDIILEPGADKISQDEIKPYINEASSFLENSKISKSFSKTSWAEIGDHYRSDDYSTDSSVVIDGDNLCMNPEKNLKGVCSKLGLIYSSRMVNGWQDGYTNINIGYTDKYDDSTNGWTKHAVASRGIESVSREALDISDLPGPLAEHIETVALPIYQELTRDVLI